MKRNVAIGLFISSLLVVLIFRRLDLNQLLNSLQSARYPYLVGAALCPFLAVLTRSLRWRILIMPLKSIATSALFSAVSIGAMTDMVLPARPGDFIRAWLIGKNEDVSKVASFATIVVERVLDIMTLLLILLFVLSFFKMPVESVRVEKALQLIGYVSGAICFAALGALMLLKYKTNPTIRVIKLFFAFLPQRWSERITGALEAFSFGLQAVKKGRHLIGLFSFSLLLWSVFAFSNYIVLSSFDLDFPVSAAFYFLIFQVLGVMIPASPGFIGTYHGAVVAGFAVFRVSTEMAFSVAVMMHAVFFIPFISLGLICLWKENLSFRNLRHAKIQALQG